MSAITVQAGDVRVPRRAREAVNRHDAVTVVVHDRPSYVILHAADYELVSPLLERHRQGRPVPFHSLLTDDDLAIMAEDRQADTDALGMGIWESWHA